MVNDSSKFKSLEGKLPFKNWDQVFRGPKHAGYYTFTSVQWVSST